MGLNGDLPLPANITAEKIAADKLQFTWDTTITANCSIYDQAMIIAYDIEHGVADSVITGEFRKTGADTLEMMTFTPARTYHLYIAFLADDRSRQSGSVYLGTMKF